MEKSTDTQSINGIRRVVASRGSGPVMEIRNAAGMTQEQFAEATGVSRVTIARAESAGRFPFANLAQRAILQFANERDINFSTIM